MNDKEALIAYYVSKWYINGLKLQESQLDKLISENLNIQAFKGFKKDFEHILSEKELNAKTVDKKAIETHSRLKDKTVTQIRSEVKEILESFRTYRIECDFDVKFDNPYKSKWDAMEGLAKADWSKCKYTMEQAYGAGFVRIIEI